MGALQLLDEAGHVHDLGVEALERQEHDREARRGGLGDVLGGDVLGLGLDAHGQHATRGGDVVALATIEGIPQLGVRIAGELRVDGQPHGLAALDRQLHRVLDTLGDARHRGDVRAVLCGRKHLRENRAQLHLAQNAALLTFERVFLRSPTPAASMFMSPRPR